jgi:hypothetical protein
LSLRVRPNVNEYHQAFPTVIAAVLAALMLAGWQIGRWTGGRVAAHNQAAPAHKFTDAKIVQCLCEDGLRKAQSESGSFTNGFRLNHFS